MTPDQILLIKGFVKIAGVGVFLIFATHFFTQIKSWRSYNSIASIVIASSCLMALSSWMVGVDIFTYPSLHFKKLCQSSGRKDYQPVPPVNSVLIVRNTGLYAHRDGFNPWMFVGGSKLEFSEEELGGKQAGKYGIYKSSPSAKTEIKDASVSNVVLEIKSISSKAELNAEIFGEEMSIYSKESKEIYSKFTYYWSARRPFEMCPREYSRPANFTLDTTKVAIDIIRRKEFIQERKP